MANPSALTVTSLTSLNASSTIVAANTIDTDGSVSADVKGDTQRLLIMLVNAAAQAITVVVKAGDSSIAGAAGQGDLSISLAASGSAGDKKDVYGLESARFIQDDGKLDLTFTAASGSPNLSVRIIRLPKV